MTYKYFLGWPPWNRYRGGGNEQRISGRKAEMLTGELLLAAPSSQ